LSSSHATAPLELIHSHVWGPAIRSFGRRKYYVIFIDDYNKFIWIYLLRHKSELFQYFLEFQSLVERSFNRKIIAVQSELGGGSMRDSIPFFVNLASRTKSLVLTPTNKMVSQSASIDISSRWVSRCLPPPLCLSNTGTKLFWLPPT
jgi:hypothetical protein